MLSPHRFFVRGFLAGLGGFCGLEREASAASREVLLDLHRGKVCGARRALGARRQELEGHGKSQASAPLPTDPHIHTQDCYPALWEDKRRLHLCAILQPSAAQNTMPNGARGPEGQKIMENH